MTAALTKHPTAPGAVDCPHDWCGKNGCEPDPLTGERFHQGRAWTVTEMTFGDILGVQVERNEGPDGESDGNLVGIDYEAGDGRPDDECLSLDPPLAREIGGTLLAASRKLMGSDPRVLADIRLKPQERLTAQVTRQRVRRDGSTFGPFIEVEVLTTSRPYPLRAYLDMSAAFFLGRYLVMAANEAEGIVREAP